LGKNLDFLVKISTVWSNFGCLIKFRLFDQNFYFLIKISIFMKISIFWWKFRFFDENVIFLWKFRLDLMNPKFGKNWHFSQKYRYKKNFLFFPPKTSILTKNLISFFQKLHFYEKFIKNFNFFIKKPRFWLEFWFWLKFRFILHFLYKNGSFPRRCKASYFIL